jgi:hypothetical protein
MSSLPTVFVLKSLEIKTSHHNPNDVSEGVQEITQELPPPIDVHRGEVVEGMRLGRRFATELLKPLPQRPRRQH